MPVTDHPHPDEKASEPVLRSLALKAKGLSGADIEWLIREARQKARRQARNLVFADIFDILASTRPEWSKELRWRMAIHEAGHAFARLALDIGRVTSISIDSPTGGYTEGETPATGSETEAFFDSLLVIRLAGRAAEEELLGSVTAGAGGTPSSDLGQATELALAMETTLGFGSKWPLLYQAVEDRSALLAYNPPTAERVNARLDNAYERARDLIGRNEGAVRFLAHVLIEHDTLEGNPLQAVLNEVTTRLTSAAIRQSSHGRSTNDRYRVALSEHHSS